MNRGHEALLLLNELVAELDKQPGPVQALLRCRPEWPYIVRARDLVRASVVALEASLPTPFERDYCRLCDAVHPPSSQPEPHGARRST